MSSMAMRLHHGALSVPSLDDSIAWYKDMLGFEVIQRVKIPGVAVEFAMLNRGDMCVELFQAENSTPMAESKREPNTAFFSQGSLHFCFAVPDPRKLAEGLQEKGADICWIRDFPWGSNAFIRDNAGNLIEFVQDKSMA